MGLKRDWSKTELSDVIEVIAEPFVQCGIQCLKSPCPRCTHRIALSGEMVFTCPSCNQNMKLLFPPGFHPEEKAEERPDVLPLDQEQVG